MIKQMTVTVDLDVARAALMIAGYRNVEKMSDEEVFRLAVESSEDYGVKTAPPFEGRTKELEYEPESDGYGIVFSEALYDPDDNDAQVFSTYNLNECPEDAIIGRDLFDASDYLRAVQYGINLAKQGYNKIEMVDITKTKAQTM